MLIKQYKYVGNLACREEFGHTVIGARIAELDTLGYRVAPIKWLDAYHWISDESQIQSWINYANEKLQSQTTTKLEESWCLKNINDLEKALRDLESPSKRRIAIKKHLRIEYRPSFIRSPFKSLLTKYLIEDGVVKVRKTLLGIKFGSRPELPVQSVTAVHANGMIWGSIVFNDVSGQPVVWNKLFRPEAVLKVVKEKLRAWEQFNDDN